MNLNLNCINVVRQLLPPHKRQPFRMKLLSSFISPLQKLFDDLNKWRDKTRMMVNVNSQVKVLESYLRNKYDATLEIKIVTFNDGLLQVGLENEGKTMWPEISLVSEKQMKPIPLENEVKDKFEGVNFIVYIPVSIDKKQIEIEIEIEKFKHALITYKIIWK